MHQGWQLPRVSVIIPVFNSENYIRQVGEYCKAIAETLTIYMISPNAI